MNCECFSVLVSHLVSNFKLEQHKELLKDSEALKKVEKGGYWLCSLCQIDKKPLLQCLRKMEVGKTSNANTHLNSFRHKETIRAMEKKELEIQKDKEKVRLHMIVYYFSPLHINSSSTY